MFVMSSSGGGDQTFTATTVSIHTYKTLPFAVGK